MLGMAEGLFRVISRPNLKDSLFFSSMEIGPMGYRLGSREERPRLDV